MPNQSSEYLYQARYSNRSERFSLGYTSRENAVNYGDSISTENVLYVGPKLPGQLAEIEENLDLTVDYGFLWWLGKPMYWFLELGNKIFNNWGMAIIFLTVVLKIITWPLSAKAYVSMGKMRELAPKMQQLQEKHGDNRQAMSQEMMQMYQKEGVNPLGGCLPMLAQLPFFLAFYWVLLETVELKTFSFLFVDRRFVSDGSLLYFANIEWRGYVFVPKTHSNPTKCRSNAGADDENIPVGFCGHFCMVSVGPSALLVGQYGYSDISAVVVLKESLSQLKSFYKCLVKLL